jgi:predicted DNA-binding protein (MmcQ/YjbR family)
MTYDWLESYATAKKGAAREFKAEWGCFRYMLRDKMFLMHGENNKGEEILTLKLAPARGQAMRALYAESVAPGYYMNKDHWNSVQMKGNVPDDALKSMIDESYALILSAFSKKIQKEIESE